METAHAITDQQQQEAFWKLMGGEQCMQPASSLKTAPAGPTSAAFSSFSKHLDTLFTSLAVPSDAPSMSWTNMSCAHSLLEAEPDHLNGQTAASIGAAGAADASTYDTSMSSTWNSLVQSTACIDATGLSAAKRTYADDGNLSNDCINSSLLSRIVQTSTSGATTCELMPASSVYGQLLSKGSGVRQMSGSQSGHWSLQQQIDAAMGHLSSTSNNILNHPSGCTVSRGGLSQSAAEQRSSQLSSQSPTSVELWQAISRSRAVVAESTSPSNILSFASGGISCNEKVQAFQSLMNNALATSCSQSSLNRSSSLPANMVPSPATDLRSQVAAALNITGRPPTHRHTRSRDEFDFNSGGPESRHLATPLWEQQAHSPGPVRKLEKVHSPNASAVAAVLAASTSLTTTSLGAGEKLSTKKAQGVEQEELLGGGQNEQVDEDFCCSPPSAGSPRTGTAGSGRQSTKPRSVAERIRRERISIRLQRLKEAMPRTEGGARVDTAAMLDDAVIYIRSLHSRCQSLERQNSLLVRQVGGLVLQASGNSHNFRHL